MNGFRKYLPTLSLLLGVTLSVAPATAQTGGGATAPASETGSAGSAQTPAIAAALESFVQRVVTLWSAGDVPALLDLLPANKILVLDVGVGIERADERHAAAALRALFADGEHLATRLARVTLASTEPARGFGELNWNFLARGSRIQQVRTVFVGAAVEGESWRITELRVMSVAPGAP